MNWFEVIPAIVVATALVVVPGAPVALAAGARGLTFLGLSVGSSIATIGISAVLAPLIHLSWNVLVPFLLSLPLAFVIYLLRRYWARRFRRPLHAHAWGRPFVIGLIAVAIGAALIGYSVIVSIQHPDQPSQTYDAIFHLNAVQQILQSGNGSTFALNLSAPDASMVFYPAAWHDATALVVQLTGVPIVVGANVMSLVIAAFVWPVSCVYLTSQLIGSRTTALIATGVVSAAFAAFPLLLVGYGVLYPNLLAFALLPIGLGALIAAIGKGKGDDLDLLARWLVVPWLVVGIGLAHPNAFFGLMVIGLPLAVQGAIEFAVRVRHSSRVSRRGTLALASVTAAILVSAIIWLRTGTTDNSWRPFQTVAQAVGEGLLNAPMNGAPAVVVSVMIVIALVLIVTRDRTYLWLVGAYLLSMALYAIVSGWPVGHFRTLMTGLWYNDSYRLAAFMVISAVPLAVYGTTKVADGILRVSLGWRWTRRQWIGVCGGVLATVVLIVTTQDASIARARYHLTGSYALNASSPVLSPDEIAIFGVVDKVVPKNAVIAGNPWNGSGLAYAYTARKVLFPHVSGAYPEYRWKIATDLSADAGAICGDLVSHNVEYVLDFGGPRLFGNDPRSLKYPGFDHLATSDAAKLVAQRGLAKLYKITACGLG